MSGRKPGRSLVLLTAATLAVSAAFIHQAPAARGAVPRNFAADAPTHVVTWKSVSGATYYNLILWLDGKRVLDLWPASSRALVPKRVSYRGAHHRLQPGRYLWFVYPGYGSKASRKYGKLAWTGVLLVTN
jgi:hypothetical protein